MRPILKTEKPKVRRTTGLVKFECETCQDRGWIQVGFYEQPCPDCNRLCKICGNQGTYLIRVEGVPQSEWPVRYCSCAVGQRMAREVFDRKFNQSQLPKAYRDCTFDSFAALMANNPELAIGKVDAFKAMRLFTQSILAGNNGYVDWYDVVSSGAEPGEDVRNWIVLWGPHGTGKTGLSASGLNELILAGQPARYIRAQAMINSIQGRYGDEEKIPNDSFGLMSAAQVRQAIKEVPILFIDELDMPDAKRDDKQSIMEDIFRYRHGAITPTVITTNLNYDQLEERWGVTTVSVIGQRAHFIHVTEPVLRAQPRRD